MPQIVAPPKGRPGVALDFNMATQPAPVYLNLRQNQDRDYRSSIRNSDNAIIQEVKPDNRHLPEKWQGNGFAGHFQFVPYLGRERLRPGVKMERDLQMYTLCGENRRPLNTLSMGGATLNEVCMPSSDEKGAHEEAVQSMRNMRRHGETHEKLENGHEHGRNELHLSTQRHARVAESHESLKGLRVAGLASVNPRMGTSGSAPNLGNDLSQMRGRDALAQWRHSTPFSLDSDMHEAAQWPRPASFTHPN